MNKIKYRNYSERQKFQKTEELRGRQEGGLDAGTATGTGTRGGMRISGLVPWQRLGFREKRLMVWFRQTAYRGSRDEEGLA